ncbi:MAG: hypothetical protein WCP20_18335 [Desulfuromonadales bacterium]
MLHIVQVVLSGIAEIPKIFLDEAKAMSAFVACAKKYWPQSYPAYCGMNGVSQDFFSSAVAFSQTFDLAEKNTIHYWIVKPEDIGLDKLKLLVSGSDDHYAGKSEHDSGIPPSSPEIEEPKEIDEKYATPEWRKYVESVRNSCGGSWGESRLFTRHDWRQDVYGNSTSFEYWEWVAAKIDTCTGKAEKAGYSVFEDPEQPERYTFKTPDGNGSEISCNTEVEAWCHAGLHFEGVK